MNKKRTKTIIEVIILTIVLVILLWVGAFLLRDKSELFCKMSFGEYSPIPSDGAPTIHMVSKKACIRSSIISFFNK